MLEGIEASFDASACSKAGIVWCAGPSSRKISVLPHQIITSRSSPCSALNARMSSRTCSASSRLLAPFFTFGPSSRLT